MSLREEILSFIDGNGLVTPSLAIPGQQQGSDNGTLFTSEYYILLVKNGLALPADVSNWHKLIDTCMVPRNIAVHSRVTVRAPNDIGVDAPDNIYGILAASKVLKEPSIAKELLAHGYRHLGFFNPLNKFNWEALQWHQLQMIFAMACAADSYRWWKPYYWFLNVYTAGVIATSCVNVTVADTTSRLLCWCLIQSVQEDSWLCRQAAKLWFRRLYKDYGSLGMKKVAYIYFDYNHPFVIYWMD